MNSAVSIIGPNDLQIDKTEVRKEAFASSLPSDFSLKPKGVKLEHNMKVEPIINNIPGNYQDYVPACLKEISKLDEYDFSELLPEVESPEEGEELLVCLDMDETMVHVDLEDKFDSHDFYINLEGQTGVNVRPGLFEFLRAASKKHHLVVFTSAEQDYADAVLDRLEERERFFKHRFYRQHCLNVNKQFHLKELSVLRRSLERVVLIDNNLYSFGKNLRNGVLISSFYCNPDDCELSNLSGYLDTLADSPDVRTVNEQIFRFEALKKYYSGN